MKFFVLLHSVSSFICLKKLIERKYIPGLVIIHEDYEKEKLGKNFFIPVKKLCLKNNIPLIETDAPSGFIHTIENYDVGICVGYMRILKKDFFEMPKHGIFNLHCGKLPQYSGRAPISRTIMNGDENLIVSLHKIDEGIDSGDIAIEGKIKITLRDDVNSLYKKFSENSYKPVVQLLRELEKGKIKLRKQKIFNKPNRMLTEDECRIDWKKNQKEIFNKIRALKFPYPGAFTTLNGIKYVFNDSKLTKIKSSGRNGEIKRVTGDSLYINSKGNLLKVTEVYCDGKKIKAEKEFFAGEKFR